MTISRLPAFGEPDASVEFNTVDGTATVANNDYVARSGTITFSSNSPSLQTVPITVIGDTTFEANEVFVVRLSNPVNAGTNEFNGVGTIFNDDIEPGFAINDVSLNEGNTGTTPFTFTITRFGNPTSFSSVVTYNTSNGTATSPDDYAALATSTVTFATNETTKTVVVAVNGDTTVEPNETFNVNVTNVTNGTISDGLGVGTIVNDDGIVNPGIEGDIVDASGGPGGDNAVLANDVTIIRQMVLGNIPGPTVGSQYQRADTNLDMNNGCGNAQIDAGDVTIIRRYNLGDLPPKPACGPTGPAPAPPSLVDLLSVGRYVRIGSTTATQGKLVSVPIEIDARGDETSAAFALNFNPKAFRFVSATLGKGTPSGANLGTNIKLASRGQIGFLIDATNTYAAGTRQMVVVTFAISPDALAGAYPLTFNDVTSIASRTGALLPTTYEPGTITIGGRFTGRG